nr:MAG TPA: hypothetical protein [Caudoviricetes sp.]
MINNLADGQAVSNESLLRSRETVALMQTNIKIRS